MLGGGFESSGRRTTPVEVVGISDAVAVRGDAFAGVANLSCIQRANGGASCWGINANGGAGTHHPDRQDQSPLARRRSQHSDALELSVGGGRVCGRHTDGGVSCWGDNGHGQLGDGGRGNSLTPVEVGVINLGARERVTYTGGRRVRPPAPNGAGDDDA